MQDPLDKRRRLTRVIDTSMNEESSSTNGEDKPVIDQNEDQAETQEVNTGPTLRRSSRKKIKKATVTENNRVTKPMKLTDKSSLKEIKKYYLDKSLKLTYNSLETIYEEPQVVDNSEVVMSSRRFKRLIDFNVVLTKYATKFKRRKAKASTVRKKRKAQKVSMEFLMEKLQEIDE